MACRWLAAGWLAGWVCGYVAGWLAAWLAGWLADCSGGGAGPRSYLHDGGTAAEADTLPRCPPHARLALARAVALGAREDWLAGVHVGAAR